MSLVLASCATAADETTSPARSADPDGAVFCNIWPHGRETLLSAWNGENPGGDHNWATRIENEVAGYDLVVPRAVRPEWNRALAVFNDIADLRFTVGYEDDNIRPEHLAMVFGEAGPEPAVADAEAAIESIDIWAAESCGDFCSRWPDMARAVDFRYEPNPGSVQHERGNAATLQGWLRVGDLLVPEAVAEAWDTARGIKASYLEMLASRNWELDYEDVAAEAASFTEYMGLSPEQAWDVSMQARDTVQGWYEENCDPAAQTTTGSGPGRLSVAINPDPSIVHSQILVAVLPDGTDFSSVRSVTGYTAGWCELVPGSEEFGIPTDIPVGEVVERLEAGESVDRIAADFDMDVAEFMSNWNLDPWGIDGRDLADMIESGLTFERIAEEYGFDPIEPFRGVERPDWAVMTMHDIDGDTEYRDDVCQFQEQEAILAPGDYELFVGVYPASPGDWRFFVSAPQACAQVPVTVGGDTTVELPALGQCPIGPVGDAAEIARRSQPVSGGDGTLRIRLEQGFASDSRHGCDLQMVLLPAGTTLNDVGRGDTWPSGGVAMHLPSEHESDTAAQPGLVPILAYPTTSGLSSIGGWFDDSGNWDASFPDPIALGAGDYDLRVQRTCHTEQDDHDNATQTCGMTTVAVNDDTVVDLPVLGECP